MRARAPALAGLAWAMVAAACGGDAAPAATPTFNRDIAPIVFTQCAPCHRPGEAGPFPLLTYGDVRRRAGDVAKVTARRYMPPWLPEPGIGDFHGERRLTDAQIAAIAAWVRAGAPEGAAADRPSPPAFVDGWQLGEPDLIVTMPQPYVLSREGTDVFRNFVLPVPVEARRHVEAVEIRPGNKKVVHHANVLVDRARASRRLDALDPEPGFAGMDLRIESDVFDPESHFLFWKPGSVPTREPPGMAWTLEPGTDLVVNAHLQPSGRPEAIQIAVGLHFSDTPPTRLPMLLQLEHDRALDIPPGASDFVVTDEFRLPLDVDLLGIYPHAHYLGRRLEAVATRPDGTTTPLIRIPAWDLSWQAVFRYRTPVFLPRGTRVSMRYSYDNSADNPANPSSPPRRVRGGNRAVDEMAHLWLQVLPRGDGDGRPLLQEALARHRLQKDPRDVAARFNLGSVLLARGDRAAALQELQAALRIEPGHPTVRNSVGTILQEEGRLDEAIREYRHVLRLEPGHLDARFNLASCLAAQGRFAAAVPHFRAVVRERPGDDSARAHLEAAVAAARGKGTAPGSRP